MKATHVFLIFMIVLSAWILNAVCSESPQELVLKYESSDIKNLSAAMVYWGGLDEITVDVPVPVRVGDVVKWEWNTSPESIIRFQVGTRAKSFYVNQNSMNDSVTHEMQKEDYIYRGSMEPMKPTLNRFILSGSSVLGITTFFRVVRKKQHCVIISKFMKLQKTFQAFKRYMPLQELYWFPI